MTPAQSPARPAGADALVCAMKAEHGFWHGEWREHAYSCRQCLSGRHCRTGNYLADMADDYGKKWRLAEERLGKEATTDTTTTAGNADAEPGATSDPTPTASAGRLETEQVGNRTAPRPDSQTTTDIEKAPVRV